MPRVSIGVPVYNGASLLTEALDCLARQTMRDFEVILSDNGSTDATPDICADFARRDSRFRHVRRETTVPPWDNFRMVRDAATAPYFLWRAYDDLSADNYLECLPDLLDARPSAALAVSNVRRAASAGTRARSYPFPVSSLSKSRLQRLHDHMFKNSAYWYYGLWRKEVCQAITDDIVERFPEPWSGDYLVLLECALRDGITGTQGTVFIQRRIREVRNYMPRPRSSYLEMSDRNRRFEAVSRALILESDLTDAEKTTALSWVPRYVRRRCYKRRTLWKAWLRQALGR